MTANKPMSTPTAVVRLSNHALWDKTAWTRNAKRNQTFKLISLFSMLAVSSTNSISHATSAITSHITCLHAHAQVVT